MPERFRLRRSGVWFSPRIKGHQPLSVSALPCPNRNEISYQIAILLIRLLVDHHIGPGTECDVPAFGNRHEVRTPDESHGCARNNPSPMLDNRFASPKWCTRSGVEHRARVDE